MNACLANLGNVATIILAIAAIFAGIFAALNLSAPKKRSRYDILLSLVNQMADREERANRAIINERFKEGTGAEEIYSWIKAGRQAREYYGGTGLLSIEVIQNGIPDKKPRPVKELIDTLNAIEETVYCFDKVGSSY